MDRIKSLTSHFMSDSLYRNSIYLFINNSMLAATGFLFWTLAARLFPANEVGLTSTIIATATFIASASLFGLDQTLIHYLAKHTGKQRAIISTACSIVTLGAFTMSVGYLLIVPSFTPELSFILSSPPWIGAFIGLMIVATWNNVLTSTFIAFRATHFVLIAGLVFGFGRNILLVLSHSHGLASLVGSYMIAFGGGVGVGLIGLYIARRYAYKPMIHMDIIRLMRRYSLRTYAASLLASVPPLLIPLFIINALGPSEVAYYNMPFLMVGLLNIISMATSQSLFAEGAHGGGQLKHHVIKSIKLIYALLIPAIALVIGLGHLILGVFGAAYADHGYMLLVFLSLSTLFKAGSFPLTAILRIVGDVKEIAIATGIYVVTIAASIYVALFFIGKLWAVGLATLLAEAVLLAILTFIVRKRWPHVSAKAPKDTITMETPKL